MLIGTLSLLANAAAETSLSYVKPSLFKSESQEGFRIMDNGKDVTSSVKGVMIGDAQTTSTGDALDFMNQAKPIMDLLEKGETSKAMSLMGKDVQNTTTDKVELLLTIGEAPIGSKLEIILNALVDVVELPTVSKAIVKSLDKFSDVALTRMINEVLSGSYAIDADGNIADTPGAPPLVNGWPMVKMPGFSWPTSPPPDGFFGAALQLVAMKEAYNRLEQELAGEIGKAMERNRQLAAEQKAEDEADARKLLADLQANPNLGLNQTAANNAQNSVRTADAKRSSSTDGAHVRLHAHPWTVISPFPFLTHPDDVVDSANATSPVPVPAGHVNVVETGASSYNQWGTWEDAVPDTYSTTPTTGPAYWIAGRITPAHGVPTSGSATYSGTLEGTMHTHVFATDDRHSPVPVTGNFSLNASFAARSLDGSFNFTSGFMPGTSLTAAGAWAPGSSQHFGDLTGAGAYDAKFSGYFFGAGAEGIGGVWNAKTTTGAPPGTEFKAYGTYNGTRGPVTP